MSIEPMAGSARPAYPRDPHPLAERLAHEEPIAFQHEHGRLYDALEHAAQVAELAGHEELAASLRRDRRDVAQEIAAGGCALRLDRAEHEALTHIAAPAVSRP